MSLFLAPIHEKVYGQIQVQELLTEKVAAAAAKNSWDCGESDLSSYVRRDSRPLADVIDTDNIHGWLQARMEDAERRFAALVGLLTACNTGIMDVLENIAASAGRERALPEDADGAEIYQGFDRVLLNGMPCDLVNQVLERDPRHFVWEETKDVHSRWWKANGMNPDLYYRLRNVFMRGMLEKTGYELIADGRTHYELVAVSG